MRRRLSAFAAAVATGAVLLACVDLFHATDFDTLCTTSPSDPACASDGGPTTDAPNDRNADGADAGRVRPHPNFCAWSSKQALEQAKRACAWLGACEGPSGTSAFGECVFRAQLAFDCKATPSLRPLGAADAFWACLATVESCAEVDGCVFPNGVYPCGPVTGAPGESSYQCATAVGAGTVVVQCTGSGGRPVSAQPCAARGQTCTLEGVGLAVCNGVEGRPCTETTCSGTHAVDCVTPNTSADRGLDCAGYGGGTCVTSDTGPFCTPGPEAEPCSPDSPPACDTGVVTACVNGKKTRVNCNVLGMQCNDQPPIRAYDLASACIDKGGSSCSSSDACLGAVLTGCASGVEQTVDCAAMGLGDCVVNAFNRPSCAPPPP